MLPALLVICQNRPLPVKHDFHGDIQLVFPPGTVCDAENDLPYFAPPAAAPSPVSFSEPLTPSPKTTESKVSPLQEAINASFEAAGPASPLAATPATPRYASAHVSLPYDQAVEWLFQEALSAHSFNRPPRSVPVYFTFPNFLREHKPTFDEDSAEHVLPLIRDKVTAMISAIFASKERTRPFSLAQMANAICNSQAARSRVLSNAFSNQCNSCAAGFRSLHQLPLNHLECGYLWRQGTSSSMSDQNSEFHGIDRCRDCFQTLMVASITEQIMAMWKMTSWSGSTASMDHLMTKIDWTLRFQDAWDRRVCLWCVDWIPTESDLNRLKFIARMNSDPSRSVMESTFMMRHAYTPAPSAVPKPEDRYARMVADENHRLRLTNHRQQEKIALLLSLVEAGVSTAAAGPKVRRAIEECAAENPVVMAPKLAYHSVDPDTMSDRHTAMETEADERLHDLFWLNEMSPSDVMIMSAVKDCTSTDSLYRSRNPPITGDGSKINFTAEAIRMGIDRPGAVVKRGGGHNMQGNARFMELISRRANKQFVLIFRLGSNPEDYRIEFVFVPFAKKGKPVVVDSDAYNTWKANNEQRLIDTQIKRYDSLTGRVCSIRSQYCKALVDSSGGRFRNSGDVPKELTAVSRAFINGKPIDWESAAANIQNPELGIDKFCAELPDFPPMAELSPGTAKMVGRLGGGAPAAPAAPAAPSAARKRSNSASNASDQALFGGGDVKSRIGSRLNGNSNRGGYRPMVGAVNSCN